mmetsp:Transcript_90946/g.253061  ORF Transcript_90946/g.253061 Transcript_90946/m.253061 type:complete len:210 (-) Transcript_90946:372-1001(-)
MALPFWVHVACAIAMLHIWIDMYFGCRGPSLLEGFKECKDGVHMHARVAHRHADEGGRSPARACPSFVVRPSWVEEHQEVRLVSEVVDFVNAGVPPRGSRGDLQGQLSARARPQHADLRGADAELRRPGPHQAHCTLAVHPRDFFSLGPSRRRHAVLEHKRGDAERIEPPCHVGARYLEGQVVVAPPGRDDHRGVHSALVVPVHEEGDQ